MPPLVLERLNLGDTPGNRRGTDLRPGGAMQNRNADRIEAAVNALSGLTLVAGPVTKLAPGANPTANLTGAAPNLTLNLGLPEGAAGAGAPNSADILAIPEMARLERSLTAAGVPDEPSLILDFKRDVHFAARGAITASIMTLITALGGVSAFTRASTATYVDSDGLTKVAANNVPRIDHDPVTGERIGLLIETQARTNSNTWSDDLTHSSYSVARLSVTGNAGTGPSGTSSMDLLTEDTAVGNSHYLYRNVGMGTGNASEQCFSMFVKANGRSRIRLYVTDFDTLGRVVSCDFNLSAGTFAFNAAVGGAVNGTAGIKNYGFGLYRVWMTGTLGGGTSTQPRVYLLDNAGAAIYTGDGASGVFSEGWQLEIGNAPSSMIYTAASAVTRAAEALVVGGYPWIGASSAGTMTLALETVTAGITPGSTFAIVMQNASGSDFAGIREGAAIGGWDLYTSVANVGVINTGGYAEAPGAVTRLAYGLEASSHAFACNNVLSFTGGASIPPNGIDRLRTAGSTGFMGHLRRVIVFPQRLSNAKVQTLSNQAAWT